MGEARTRCRKCLLSEIDPEAYMRELKLRIDRAPERDRTAPEAYSKRLDTCRECDWLDNGTCMACGCFVELRAAFKRNRCPYKKWDR